MLIKKMYLLIPSVPTPNGPLHLGHIGGPYLRADMLARYLRSQGHHAVLISGTDSYESYVSAQAVKENSTPEKIGTAYHALIAKDLSMMDIHLDQFINPLHAQYQFSYKNWHQIILQQLLKNGVTYSLQESVGWDTKTKRYLTGCWLHGYCPFCKANITGYFCEACGAHFRPEQVIREYDSIQKQVQNIFLRLPTTFDLQKKGIATQIENKYRQFLSQQNYSLRLTANSDWGLPYNTNSTLFNYGFMFAYFLMFGEIAGKLFGINKNVFAQDSSVITISSFGLDNSIPFLSSACGISAACTQYKAFDYYLVNYFYFLNGSKFSTSRRHAIWVNDIMPQRLSDVVRLYLASIDVSNQTGHFNSSNFNRYYNNTLAWIEEFILQALTKLPAKKIYHCDSHYKQKLHLLLTIADRNLQPDHFFPHLVTQTVDAWLRLAKNLTTQHDNYFWWLQAFSLFIYPFMPKIATATWQALGFKNVPDINHLFIQPTLPLQREIAINLKPIGDQLTSFEVSITT